MELGLTRKDENIFIKKDTDYYAKYDLEIIVPDRYIKSGFVRIDSTIDVLGICMVKFSDKHYKLLSIPLMLKIEPFKTEKFKYDDEDYISFKIRKGDIFTNSILVQSPDAVKPLFTEFIIKGKVPKFVGYEDLRNIFDSMGEYTGMNIVNDKVAVSMLVASIARTEQDTTLPYRLAEKGNTLKWVGLASVGQSRPDTFSRITNAYLKDGITASLLDDIDKVNGIEQILL